VGPQTYLDFDVAVSRHGDELAVRVLSSPAGETAAVRSPWPEAVNSWSREGLSRSSRRLNPVAAGPTDLDPAVARAGEAADARRAGSALFAALLSDTVLVRFRESVSRAASVGSGLRLMLRFEGGADVLPWELLRDPQTGTFVALDPSTPVIRCTETALRELGDDSSAPLRILVAVSSPLATTPIDGARERAALAEKLAPVTVGSAVVIDVLENASLDDIREALHAKETHVFHYIGHGTVGAHARSALVLTDSEGMLSVRSIEDVAAVLGTAHTLRLVVLNSCHGSLADPTDPFAGAGTTLVQAGIPAVVAMRTAVTDVAAVAFAAKLYESLATAAPIEDAVTQARARMADMDGPVAHDWPVVALHLSSSVPAGLRAGLLPRIDEDVEFTIARPQRLLVESWETLLVLAHHGEPYVAEDGRTVDQAAQVRQRVAGFFGEHPARSTTEASDLALPRGARLVVAPELPDHVECYPRQADLAWTGDIAEVMFALRARATSADTTVEGWLRIFCGPVVIAETRLELPVVRDGSAAEPLPPAPVPRYRKIFPCFDRADTAVVEGVAAVAEALGDDYLDRVVSAQQHDAPAGWLLPLIDEADVFQLFWSTQSMISPGCRQQWEHALARAKEGFVLPLYWQQPFPKAVGLPPPELASLEFRRLPSALAATPTPLPPPVGTTPPAPPARWTPPAEEDPPAPGEDSPLPPPPMPGPMPGPIPANDPRLMARKVHRTGGSTGRRLPVVVLVIGLAVIVAVVWALTR